MSSKKYTPPTNGSDKKTNDFNSIPHRLFHAETKEEYTKEEINDFSKDRVKTLYLLLLKENIVEKFKQTHADTKIQAMHFFIKDGKIVSIQVNP